MNVSIVEKVEFMLQKDPIEVQKKNIMSRKFDDDYKKLRKIGEKALDTLNPFGIPG
jgi:hypothetical protein